MQNGLRQPVISIDPRSQICPKKDFQKTVKSQTFDFSEGDNYVKKLCEGC